MRIYSLIKNASARWTMPIKDWGLAVNQFAILFDGRVPGFHLHTFYDRVVFCFINTDISL